jgi:hypothetical protein
MLLKNKPVIAGDMLMLWRPDQGGMKSGMAFGCFINIIQSIDESRCICAVLTAGGLRREPTADVPPPVRASTRWDCPRHPGGAWGHPKGAAPRVTHWPRVTDERLGQLLPSREHQAEGAPNRGKAVVAGLAISGRHGDQ